MTTTTAAPAPAPDRPALPVVGSLSPSRAGDFMTCPLLYRFRTIDRLPEPPSSAATRGTLVHAALESLFDLPAAERTPERAAGLLGSAWEALQAEEPAVAGLFADGEELATWLSSARELLDAYFALEDPRRLEPASREELVEVLLPGGLRLRGIVDRLDLAPTGELRVVDYKTARAPGEAFEGKALFQMKFYGLVLWRTRGTVPALLQLMYLGNGQVLRYVPDEADLLAVERKLLALWQAIERATQARDFRPRPSRLCDWCAHQALCPAFGGTPPPFPAAVPGPDELLPHQQRAARRSEGPTGPEQPADPG
ncbi:MAG TPA: PD-(D/E)XK nuclease family protein [Mycobacteriales bacterium]|nr:PD-(D/E)XK nuclease family protein [Mycobacteriales bacterium]